MTINGKAYLTEPDEVLITIELTMSAGNFRRLQAQLEAKYPASVLSTEISILLSTLREKIEDRREFIS